MQPLISLTALLLLSTSLTSLTSLAADRSLVTERMKERMQQHIQMMDSNGDGQISHDEYLANAEKQFKRMDRDGDGQISPEERAQLHEQMMQHRGEHTP
ncbi:hypothetical protein D3880_16655 [Pseudomonas cavernae]|uniref:EF-hand domain-containing protein n=1 Tax=Pseudomonas cavernae TaxID=2320867 RepID=A0A385Z3P4_9PSED|nr:hypothetical protein [Pseudomonas cavernae]AYC33889.1 hypothetical protein D3880_16655 [Pseudomonas cavernae]